MAISAFLASVCAANCRFVAARPIGSNVKAATRQSTEGLDFIWNLLSTLNRCADRNSARTLAQGLQVSHQVMNVVVGVLSQQLDMSFGGSVDGVLDRICRPGLIPSRLVGHSDGEFILIGELAGNSLAGGESHRHGCGSVLGIEHPLFKFQSAKTPGHAGQITSGGMAGRAGPSAIEILFASLDVAGLKIADRYASPSARPGVGLFLLCMKESRQIGYLLRRELECRHAVLGASSAHKWADLVAAEVFRNQL